MVTISTSNAATAQYVRNVPNLNDEHFALWQKFVESKTGIRLPVQRRSFLQTSLGLRMLELGLNDYEAYYQYLHSGISGAIEWDTLVDRLMVQETRFWRDQDSMQLVSEHIRSVSKSASKDVFHLWSVGCSSGEEAYSLAHCADQALSQNVSRFAVTGTDISTHVLRRARRARYNIRAIQAGAPYIAHDIFEEITPSATVKSSSVGSEYQIKKYLRDRCCFSQVNIMNLRQCPLFDQDVIYCQNVLIYFRRWRRKEILSELAQRLSSNGILVLGLGEITDWSHPLLEPIKNSKVTAFRRVDSAEVTGGTRR